jgi:hypothetical protein
MRRLRRRAGLALLTTTAFGIAGPLAAAAPGPRAPHGPVRAAAGAPCPLCDLLLHLLTPAHAKGGASLDPSGVPGNIPPPDGGGSIGVTIGVTVTALRPAGSGVAPASASPRPPS